MTGKIDGYDNRPVQAGGQSSATRTSGKSAASAAPKAPDAGHVKLTDSAVQLAALEKALAQVPDVDHARVQAVKAEIASGQYKVDAHRMAAKLLELERALAAAESGASAQDAPLDAPGKQV